MKDLKFKEEIKQYKQELNNEKEKNILINSYWERECKEKEEKVRASVRRFLAHEINEIKLCLDRENPNVEMALRRVSNIEAAYLRRG